MKTAHLLPVDIKNKMSQLLLEVKSLKKSLDEFSLTKDDLAAIRAGLRDHKLGRTRRL